MGRSVPVLVVGGGPTGLAVAGELGSHGVSCELIEQGDGAVRTPKLTEVNIRTMELCRRWGIADAVLGCPFPNDYPLDVVFLRNLASEEIARIERPARNAAQPEPHSPMRFQACSQMWFDPVLQSFARSFPAVRLRYKTRLEAFRQSSHGVEATVVDLVTGEKERIVSSYLVACDGAGSGIRNGSGIPLIGDVLGHTVHMHFRAPRLLEAFGKAAATFLHLVDHDGLWATMRVIDPADGLWRLMVLHVKDAADAGSIDSTSVLRKALGCDHEVQWIDSYVWTRRSMVAERYQDGRILLVGDAAHQFSPTGALGMNTGIADAVDVGWKLSAVLKGWGGKGLLGTYDVERRPVAVTNARMTRDFYHEYTKFDGCVAKIDAEEPLQRTLQWQHFAERLIRDVGRNFKTIGLQIGYRYDRTPICVNDGTPHSGLQPDVYEPSTCPGVRAPHAWLSGGRSTLDLFSHTYVVLRLGSDAPDTSGLEAAAKERGVPCTTCTLTDPEVRSLYERSLVIVRPDGHVCWRGNSVPRAPERIMDQIRGEIP